MFYVKGPHYKDLTSYVILKQKAVNEKPGLPQARRESTFLYAKCALYVLYCTCYGKDKFSRDVRGWCAFFRSVGIMRELLVEA